MGEHHGEEGLLMQVRVCHRKRTQSACALHQTQLLCVLRSDVGLQVLVDLEFALAEAADHLPLLTGTKKPHK